MKEKNRKTLTDALGRLQEHTPPAGSWDDIANHLSGTLRERLPTYVPPTGVWNALSQQLSAEREAGTSVRRLWPRSRAALGAIAAGFALLLTVGITLFQTNAGPTITYAYAQEPSPAVVVADWNDDEASFTRARQQVADRNEPRLNNLGYELDELNQAREEVKSMLVAYGEDPGVIRQLAEIERERDDVYRRIIVEL